MRRSILQTLRRAASRYGDAEPDTDLLVLGEADYPVYAGYAGAGAQLDHHTQQVRRAMEHLIIRSYGTLWERREDDTVQAAANILRAGPDASPLLQVHGRHL